MLAVSPGFALTVVCNCVARYDEYVVAFVELVALPVASGPVAPKQTVTPEPIEIAEVMSTVKFESATAEGVT